MTPGPSGPPIAIGIHPWLMVTAVLLVAWAAARVQVQQSSFLPALMVALGATTAAYALFRLAVRQHHRAAVLTTLTMWWVISPTFVGHAAGLGVATVIVVAAIIGVLRTRASLRSASGLFDIATAALLIVPGFELLLDLGAGEGPRISDAPRPLPSATPSPPAPDIYVVILDAYGRSDVLQGLYAFDNKPFLGALQDLGFSVADRARSNYGQTGLSVASLLNADYLDELLVDLGPGSKDRRPLHRLITNAMVMEFLREQRYELVNLRGPFSMTDLPQVHRKVQPLLRLDDFHYNLLSLTTLPVVSRLAGWGPGSLQHTQWARQIRWSLDALPHVVPDGAPPTFVFVHIVSPHPPFVLHEDGAARDVSHEFHLQDGSAWRGLVGVDDAEYRAHYVEQLVYTNEKILAAVEQITARQRPAHILLMSDHGPGALFEPGDPNPSPEAAHERFGILLAWYGGELASSATPINAVRALLREAVGADLPPVDDRSWHSTYQDPYVFSPVAFGARDAEPQEAPEPALPR